MGAPRAEPVVRSDTPTSQPRGCETGTTDVRVPRAVLDAITSHARRESPRECCGLLIGTDTEVAEAVPATNAADDPLRRYEVSPIDYLTQIRRCRELAQRGEVSIGVVGAYHSHPRSAPEPSPTDLAQAFEEFLYVIAGPVDVPDPVDTRAYRLRSGRFEAVALIVVEPPETTSPRATAP
ncbi:MAG: Mov34/MPN/PAD-1 family protein [Vicinamibacterales bacterium]